MLKIKISKKRCTNLKSLKTIKYKKKKQNIYSENMICLSFTGASAGATTGTL